MHTAYKSDFHGIVPVKIRHSKLSQKNPQKITKKKNDTKKANINSFRNRKRTRDVIAAFCNTYSNIYYSVQLCLLLKLSIKMPPGIMV